LQAEQIRLPHQFAMFDLVLMGQQTGAGLSLAFQYNADLFEPATIDDMAGQFRQLLRSIVACPSTPVGALSMLDEAQRRRTLHQSRSAEPASEAADPVHIQIAAQAARSPDAMAVIGIREGEQLTYRQLDEQSDQLAARLGKVVSKPDSTIAICLDRSPTMIVAVLGALKSGAAYLPLDPNIPQNRLQFQLEDAAPAAILTSGQLAERFDGAAMPVMWLDDAAYDGPPSPSKASGLKATAGGDLAYVMYTSGSTGRPKGVEIEHRALAGYTATAAKMFQLDPDDRVLQFAALAFDTAAEEIFPTLTRGATLVLRDEAMLGSAGAFFEACRRHAITVLDLPTAFWRQLVRQMEQQSLDPPAELRLVILGGERARRDCWEIWRRRVGDRVRLLNTYGPTEATIVSTVWDATTDEAPGREIPIGRPVAGAAAYILDNRGQLAAPGTPGELHLGGPGLARGYRNRPQLDAERFIPNPFTDAASPRLYRTGDLVRRLPCGELEFLGRTDGQIKLRGFRIEPGEIEAVLCEHSDVTEAAVIAHEDSSGRLQLAAYVGSTQASPPTVDMLRRHVRQKLPDYMTPTQWVVLGELPHTTSGKIDRPHLPRPTADRAASAVEYAAPRTPGEQALAHVWSRVLEIERVGVDDNFFDLGGDSLLAIQLAASAAEDGLPLTAGLVMQHQTIAAQAGALASGAGEFNSPATLVPIQPRGERSPLFVVHPTGGIVTPYYHLAHLLGEDQPVVGIQAQGVFDAQPPHQSVEAMAAHYVAALRASQAEGPYHLAGWSLGGLVALEMARQLRQAGCDVGLVALVDASPAGAAQTEEQVFGMLAASLPELALMDLADFELLPRDEQIAYFAQQITAAGMAPAEFAATHARRLFDVFEAHLQAGRDYRPQPYDGPLHAFVASESSTGSQATAFDWSPTASAAASEELPGNHWTLLREPAVSRLAARLTDLLAR
jgi:aspartate racemase